MEKVLNKSLKYSLNIDLKFIDVVEGSLKFEGNLLQYKNMLSMFDKLTIDDYIPEIAHHLKQEDLSHAIVKIRSLSEAALVNEVKRYCRSCFTLIEHLEGYETKSKTALETIDAFKTFLDDTVLLKREIEEFTGKPVSFDNLNNVCKKIRDNILENLKKILKVLQMKQSIEGKKLFENTFSLPLQENKGFDEKRLIFGGNERKEIKLPESSRVGISVSLNRGNTETKNEGQSVQVVSSIKKKASLGKEEDNCLLI